VGLRGRPSERAKQVSMCEVQTGRGGRRDGRLMRNERFFCAVRPKREGTVLSFWTRCWRIWMESGGGPGTSNWSKSMQLGKALLRRACSSSKMGGTVAG
jgi:hypothetical protein